MYQPFKFKLVLQLYKISGFYTTIIFNMQAPTVWYYYHLQMIFVVLIQKLY